MIALTLAEMAAAVGGTLADADPQASVSGPVVVDSRAVTPGALFVAIQGARVDGHEHAADAFAAGAVACLGSRPVGMPTVVVDDPVAVCCSSGCPNELAVSGIPGSGGRQGRRMKVFDPICRS